MLHIVRAPVHRPAYVEEERVDRGGVYLGRKPPCRSYQAIYAPLVCTVVGVGVGLTRDCSTLMVAQYFKRRRELVEIFIVSGSGLGIAVMSTFIKSAISLSLCEGTPDSSKELRNSTGYDVTCSVSITVSTERNSTISPSTRDINVTLNSKQTKLGVVHPTQLLANRHLVKLGLIKKSERKRCPSFDRRHTARNPPTTYRKNRAHREERQSGVRAYAAIAEIAVTESLWDVSIFYPSERRSYSGHSGATFGRETRP
ncbi:hypothetical protein EVAR_41242_1 [Eumeta japonica]|uniref:Uncharacterized protein n=1 Tax=Eumeta variegata TaxID=151549 RepID=A0A4C1W4W3_EUMVA|nr:hypothetical protein EVAR_41242_1 [Eumeta japonica]